MRVTVIDGMIEHEADGLQSGFNSIDEGDIAAFVGGWLIAVTFRYERVTFVRIACDEVVHYDARSEDNELVAYLTLCGVTDEMQKSACI